MRLERGLGFRCATLFDQRLDLMTSRGCNDRPGVLQRASFLTRRSVERDLRQMGRGGTS